MATKRVKTREVVADIKAGMNDQALMRRYGLSEAQLDLLLRKLLESKLVTAVQLSERSSLQRSYEQNATEILADFKAGMDDEPLMRKYRMTPEDLTRLYDKLMEAGDITVDELYERQEKYNAERKRGKAEKGPGFAAAKPRLENGPSNGLEGMLRVSRSLLQPGYRDFVFQDLCGTACDSSPGGSKMFAYYCMKDREEILRCFPSWLIIPKIIWDDPKERDNYVNGLVAVARFYSERLGDQSLMQMLQQTGVGRYFEPRSFDLYTDWKEKLDRSSDLMEKLDFPQARAALDELLVDVERCAGPGAHLYAALAYRKLGECFFQDGMAEAAIERHGKALYYSRKSNHSEGAAITLANLYESSRYLGDPESAATYADKLSAEILRNGGAAGSEWWRKQAVMVRAGQPLLRVVLIFEGRYYELDSIPKFETGNVELIYERNRISLRKSLVWTREAKAAASAGRYDEALELCAAASKADPYDPDPKYQEGMMLLELERYNDAARAFESTERLAPGWFHNRSWLWIARQLARGKVQHLEFKLLRVLGDGPMPLEKKIQMGIEAFAKNLRLPHLYLAHGENLVKAGRRDEAARFFQAGLKNALDPDLRTRLLVALGAVHPDKIEGARLFGKAVELNGNLVAAAQALIALKSDADQWIQ